MKDVLNAINNMRTNKISETDDIYPKILKETKNVIYNTLPILLNKS